MRPVRVAFSKLNVLLIGQNDPVRERVRSVLSSLGVARDRICECNKRDQGTRRSVNDFDLVILDYDMERFSRELLISELNDEADVEQSIPVVLIAEKGEMSAIAHSLNNREHTVISHSFCPKSLCLKLNLLLTRVRSSLVSEDEVGLDERLSGDLLAGYSA